MAFKKITALGTVFLILAVGCAPLQKAVQKGAPPPESATPAPLATPPPGPANPTGPVTIAFTGDIMMGGSAAHKLKTQGPDSFFKYAAPLLKEADLAMGNLEGPLGTGGEKFPHKKYNFLVDPSSATGLAHAGFTLLTLANNHTMDFGVEALQSTIQSLDAEGLKHCGAGMNDVEARQPAWLEARGHKVAVLAYSLTYPTEYWATISRPGCAPASGPDIKEDIAKARSQGADLVFVCFHWGQEKHTRLRGYQPSLAHVAIDAGADAVVCHHPHIWQALEVYKGKPIAYAIGNFAFGTLTSIRDSGILYLTYDEKARWTGGRIVPLNVNNFQVGFTPRPMTQQAASKFFFYLKKLSGKKVKLRLFSGKHPSILWEAPPPSALPPPVAANPATPVPSPVPTSNSPTPTPHLIPTPTFDPAGNPQGSVPGVENR